VDHDLDAVVRIFQRQQLLDVLLFFRTLLVGVDLHGLVGVAPLEESRGLDERAQLGGVLGVLGDDQHEGLHEVGAVVAGIDVERVLGVLVDADRVLQLDPVQLLG